MKPKVQYGRTVAELDDELAACNKNAETDVDSDLTRAFDNGYRYALEFAARRKGGYTHRPVRA